MQGSFKQRVSDSIICFICGLFVCGLFAVVEMRGNNAVGIIVGVAICIYSILSFFFNYKAYIRIADDTIKAKYHWFGNINCKISDVCFAMAQMNTLIIVLKGGKTHTIMGVSNAYSLASAIRQNMDFEAAKQPKALITELDKQKAAKKKGLIYVCAGAALMFIHIFITVGLTGGKDLHMFRPVDWAIMAVMGVIEIGTVIATFCYAQKTGKYNIPIAKLQYEIRRSIIETYPLVPGKVLKVYADENYTGRVTVFGFPNEDSVFYTEQVLDDAYSLVIMYESEQYENIQQLPDDAQKLIDITEKFI